jgi:RNA polymerase sigma factor (sigma-70 family)
LTEAPGANWRSTRAAVSPIHDANATWLWGKLKDMAEDKPPIDAEIARLLALLDESDRKLLQLRFGLDRHEPRTLEELGALLGLSRARVRAAEDRAMEKLKELGAG